MDDQMEVEASADGAAEEGFSSDRVVALIENRAREVGLAVLDMCECKLELMQFVESSRSYAVTLNLLRQVDPGWVIVVERSSAINQVCREFHQVVLPRRAFDDTAGQDAVAHYASSTSEAVSPALHKAYYLAFGSAGALLQNLEDDHPFSILPGTLEISYRGPADFLQIDTATVQALELVSPSSPSGAPKSNKRGLSMFHWLNYTLTSCGAKLLRANLLQPLTHVDTITLRQDALQELIENEVLAFDLTYGLQHLPKTLDRMCNCLAVKPKDASSPCSRIARDIQANILLHEVLASLPTLVTCLASANTPLLQAAHANMSHGVFDEMLNVMRSILDDDVHSHKGVLMNRVQQCFAVKKGQNELLDLARSTFQRLSDEIHALLPTYQEDHGLPTLRLSFTSRRGFFFVLPRPGSKTKRGVVNGHLPRTFLPLEGNNKGASLACTTHELNAFNARLKDATNDCLVLTDEILEGLMTHLRKNLPFFHKLLDTIALLDMLSAFRTAVTESHGEFVRPNCVPDGPLAVVEGHHPLAEMALDGRNFQPNDTYLADCSSCQLITGPNMSGKSTFLRQVAIVVVLAQIGCSVPAKFASLRIVDRLFARMGTGDSIEMNCSSFMMEMQETAFILDHATPRSLVLIDELGRATSTADGVGIAWAVAEHLIALGAATLFATHFSRLSELAVMYPNCKLWHLDVAAEASEESAGLKYIRKLQPGSQQVQHYGLALAPAVGIPSDVIDEATAIAVAVDSEERRTTSRGPSPQEQENCKLYDLAHKVFCVAQAHRYNAAVVLDCGQQMAQLKTEAIDFLSEYERSDEPMDLG